MNEYETRSKTYILHDKKTLRKQMLMIRDSIPQALRAKKSRQILEQLYRCSAYQSAGQVLSYVSFRSEADTMPLLKRVLQDGKELYCPLVSGKQMDFYRVRDLSDLQPGAYGISEPTAHEENRFCAGHAMQKDRKDTDNTDNADMRILMILPGAVFDKNGFRIGYGGGYYDKYLAEIKGMQEKGLLTTAALLFREQLVEELPREAHDLSVDLLVTEDGLIDLDSCSDY